MPKKIPHSFDAVIKTFEAHKDYEKTAKELNIGIATVYRYVAIHNRQNKIVEVKTKMENNVVVGDLAGYIPTDSDPEIRDYKPRPSHLRAVKSYTDKNLAVLFIGEAGTGKTSLSRYLAYVEKLPFLEVSCDSLLGFRELLGQVNITDGTSHFIEGLFTKFIQQPSVILLDEITALDPGKNFMLHQLLNSREFFVKEAERGKGKTYRLHDQCKIILACNPPNSKYPGTNRLNVALVDRPQVIWFDELTLDEVKKILPDSSHKSLLIRFYADARQVIHKNDMRTTFSVRSLKKITNALTAGVSVNEAVHHGFLNGVKATAGKEGYQALLGIAQTIWPEVKAI